jgi:uncharacterized protein
MLNYILIFIIILIASMIQGATGFGFAILAMPLLVLILPVKMATLIVLILAFILAFMVFYQLKEHVNIKIIKFVIVGALAGRLVGMFFLENLNNNVLEIILGISLILLSLYLKINKENIEITPSKKNGIISGFLSGILGGMFNISGPPLVIFYLATAVNKKEYQASLQLTFVLTLLYSILLHSIYGNINLEVFKFIIPSVIAVSIGTYLGLNIFKKIDLERLYSIIICLMIVMGLFITANNF